MDPGIPERTQFPGIFKELNRRITALENANPGALSADAENTYLASGSLILSEDGAFVVQADDGTPLTRLDKTKLRFNRSGGSRQLEITPAGGMKFYRDNGSTVITTLNADGLEVIGGFVTPVWPASEGGNVDNASITTTQTDFVTVTFDPPNWVETLVLLSVARLKLGNVSGAEYNAQVGLTNDDGGAHENRVWSEQTVPDDTTQSIVMSNREEIPLSPAGRQVDVVVDAFLSSGSNSSNNVSLSIIGFGIRNP